MNGRFAKILILVLCGTLLLVPPASAGFFDFLFGTPAPTPAPVVSPGGGTTTQVAAATPDLANIESLLQTINNQLTLIAENTHQPGKPPVTGNLVLFDTSGNLASTITNGTSVVALPQGACDIAVYGNSISMYITVEELKDYESTKITRNLQSCVDDYLCRRTVTLDSDFSYLYLTYKPYNPTDRLDRITLSYWCNTY